VDSDQARDVSRGHVDREKSGMDVLDHVIRGISVEHDEHDRGTRWRVEMRETLTEPQSAD